MDFLYSDSLNLILELLDLVSIKCLMIVNKYYLGVVGKSRVWLKFVKYLDVGDVKKFYGKLENNLIFNMKIREYYDESYYSCKIDFFKKKGSFELTKLLKAERHDLVSLVQIVGVHFYYFINNLKTIKKICENIPAYILELILIPYENNELSKIKIKIPKNTGFVSDIGYEMSMGQGWILVPEVYDPNFIDEYAENMIENQHTFYDYNFHLNKNEIFNHKFLKVADSGNIEKNICICFQHILMKYFKYLAKYTYMEYEYLYDNIRKLLIAFYQIRN